tara:strand:- start:184 stop:1209 length:1026 start_codon:yes stop_codon:yes gene_type:complete
MTQENSYNRHTLYIDDEEIKHSSKGNIIFNGNNQTNTLSASINNIDLQNHSLFNKRVELYLNENGSEDSVPIFRGIIKSFTNNEKELKITAHDVRTILGGNEGLKINLDDFNNADGKTVGQFLYETIKDKINYNKTRIGLDMLNDCNPPALLNGKRGKNLDLYKIVTDAVSSNIDDTNVLEPLSFFVDVYEGEEYSSIVIVKDKSLDSIPAHVFSYEDGLAKLTFKRRNPVNTVYYKGRVFEYTNRSTGQTTINIEDKEDIGESRNLALKTVLLNQQQVDDINIKTTKGFYIPLGTIINLDVPDDLVSGNHRVQGKKISFGNTLSCNLTLNRKPVKVSDYL